MVTNRRRPGARRSASTRARWSIATAARCCGSDYGRPDGQTDQAEPDHDAEASGFPLGHVALTWVPVAGELHSAGSPAEVYRLALVVPENLTAVDEERQTADYRNDSPEQTGSSSPLTMFGSPFWVIRRSGAAKSAVAAATSATWAPISQISPLNTRVFPLVSEAGRPYRPAHPPVPIIAQTVKRHT